MSDDLNSDPNSRPGPDPERLQIEDMTWEEAIAKALRKKRPPEGWPDDRKKGETDDESEKPETERAD